MMLTARVRDLGALLVTAALAASVQGCGSNQSGEGSTFRLVVTDAPIVLEAPTSQLIQLLVIGASGEPVTITAPGAPAFVSISGALLTLAPERKDVGEHAITLVARTAADETSGTIHVVVTRTNTGPHLLPLPFIKGTETDGSARPIVQAATLTTYMCDFEGDNFVLEIAVVPAGQPFTQASYSHAVDFALTPPLSYELPDSCAWLEVPLTGLEPGDHDVAVRGIDALGLEDPYGWIPVRGFTLAP